jgi:hypothetical protein
MVKFLCVTSMTDDHVSDIGKYMINSWQQFWPSNSKLIVYAENFSSNNTDNINFLDWNEYCLTPWTNFTKKENDINSIRFAKKGYAFLDAMKRFKNNGTYIVWLDADLLFKKHVPENIITSLISDNKLISLFDLYYRLNPQYTNEQYINPNRKFAAESGFVLLNTNHQMYDTYINNYEMLYNSEIKDQTLTSWYDGEVVLSAAKDFLNYVEDLSLLRYTNKTQTPLNRCRLTEYMTHVKGKVKKTMKNSDFEKIVTNNDN